MDRPTYDRARAAGIPASSALRLARWAVAPLPGDVPQYGASVEWPERDGFALTLSVTYDEGLTLQDMGYGTFLDGAEDWRTGYERRPDPDAVPNPHRDTRNPSNGAGWYLPGDAGTLRERAIEYRRMGYSRGPAWDKARESMDAELSTVTNDYGPAIVVLTVKASRNGITLGRASLGGIELGWDPITRTSGDRYLADAAEDIIPDAIADAREALAGLTEGLVTA